jgi:hypothetical protein
VGAEDWLACDILWPVVRAMQERMECTLIGLELRISALNRCEQGWLQSASGSSGTMEVGSDSGCGWSSGGGESETVSATVGWSEGGIGSVDGGVEGSVGGKADRSEAEVVGRMGALWVPESEMRLSSEEKRRIMACLALLPPLLLR